MSWRGQGRRAKGRRGDQDPEVDNSAWLAELEREAAQAGDDDEDDWASTLRGRRGPTPPSPAPPPAPPSDPSWAPLPDPGLPPPLDDRFPDPEPGGAGSRPWAADPGYQEPPPPPDPDWAWRPPASDLFEPPGEPVQGVGPDADWGGSRESAGDEEWRRAPLDTPTGVWSPEDPVGREPVGREPDYPALFGELYRRSSSQQDPIWEPPPEPAPDQGQPDPPSGGWPSEETTQSWEPSDRSFDWSADEPPSTQAGWEPSPASSWLDEPPPVPSDYEPPDRRFSSPDPGTGDPGSGEGLWTAASALPAEPPGSPSGGADSGGWGSGAPFEDPGGPGNGLPPMAPPQAGPVGPAGTGPPPGPVRPMASGPPPADWAAAIPTDVPAARRAADPTATRVWRPDAVDAEPGVPLGSAQAGPAAVPRRPGPRATAPAGPGAGAGTADPRVDRAAPAPAEEPGEVRRKARPQGRGRRQPGERQARAWPRIVAVISWIVLVMVVCWFYVFPWLERVLPENF
jgi:hypothetical protein